MYGPDMIYLAMKIFFLKFNVVKRVAPCRILPHFPLRRHGKGAAQHRAEIKIGVMRSEGYPEKDKAQRRKKIPVKHRSATFLSYFKNYTSFARRNRAGRKQQSCTRTKKAPLVRGASVLSFCAQAQPYLLPGNTKDKMRQEKHELRDISRNEKYGDPAADHKFDGRSHAYIPFLFPFQFISL